MSLARPEEKTIENSPFFVRHGCHCCREDLLDRQYYEFFFELLVKVSFVAVACFFPGRAKDLSAPRYLYSNCLFTIKNLSKTGGNLG